VSFCLNICLVFVPPSRYEVKNAWRNTSTPQYVFMAWYLIKHRDIIQRVAYENHVNFLWVEGFLRGFILWLS
jgi:hypothetical protein